MIVAIVAGLALLGIYAMAISLAVTSGKADREWSRMGEWERERERR